MCPENTTVAYAALDVRVGGQFRIDMADPDSAVLLVHTGEYIEVSPPHRLVFTWISDGTQQQRTLVTIELREHSSGCELTLTHEQLPDASSVERHEKGWGQILLKLAHHLI